MKTFLAQNAFISNSDAVIPISAPDTAVAPKPQPPLPDATAVLNSVSPGDVAAPHNSGEREPVSDAGLPSGGSLSSGDLRASSLRAGEDEPLLARSPGGSSSDGLRSSEFAALHPSEQSGHAAMGKRVGVSPTPSEGHAGGLSTVTTAAGAAGVDLHALWDCITDDRIVLIGRGDDPDRPMFLETFRLGEVS